MTNNSTIATETEVAIVNNLTWDDATWILTSSFIIFTMQSGFGLLESGAVTSKNEVNIMIKNVADVIFGGMSYWMIGFGLSFGKDQGSNAFVGVGYFFVDSVGQDMGQLFATFVFQLSFATTATTIVSGAMAERTKLTSYIVYSFFNTYVYCIPAHWMWDSKGFLSKLGCVDIAGSGVVHLCGGTAALVASILLKPRLGRYDNGTGPPPLGNPVNTIIGLFMLWWGWLGFNCGSTFGISSGKWKLAAKSAVITMNGSVGGGFVGIVTRQVSIERIQTRIIHIPPCSQKIIDNENPNFFRFFLKMRNEAVWLPCVILFKRKYDVSTIVNSVLGGLVSITSGCAVIRPWEAVLTGVIGGSLTVVSARIFDKLKIDDPVGAISVHGACGCWGMVAVGLFAQKENYQDLTQGRNGLIHGGGFYLLGVQTLACVVIIAWAMAGTFLILWPLKMIFGIRMSPRDEELGADIVEHNIYSNNRNNSNIIFASRRSSRAYPTISTLSKESLQLITISDVQNKETKPSQQSRQHVFCKFIDQVMAKLKRKDVVAPIE